jgi:hypothetical protein
MAGLFRKGLLSVCLALVLVQSTFALFLNVPADYNISHLDIEPSGTLTSGTPVSVSFEVTFPILSGQTFPSGNDLVMRTDLESPKWNYTLTLNRVEKSPVSTGGSTLDLFGLTYSTYSDESIRVLLEGTAPDVNETINETVIDVYEIGSCCEIYPEDIHTVLVINPVDFQNAVNNEKNNLSTFQSNISEKSAINVDTTEAQADYNDASTKISSAQARPATQFSDALNDLTAAQASIDAGETALDKAWAEKSVADAEIPLQQTDQIISWYEGNKSTADDEKLPSIIAQRDLVASALSSAKDDIANGNYSEARAEARDAYQEGNASFHQALTCQYQLTSCCTPFKNPVIRYGALGIVTIIILFIVGIVFMARRKKIGGKPQ